MSLLDQLQLEVDRIKAEEERRNALALEQQEFYSTSLRAVMQRASAYFSDLVEKLNIVSPDIKASYPLDPTRSKGIVLKQDSYKFRTDSGQNPHLIDIACVCSLERPHEFYVPTKAGALKYAELLDSYNFPHHRKNKLDKLYDICGATFILEGPMKMHIRLLARAGEKCVYVILRNVDGPEPRRFKFSPESVDDHLLERLAKLLIREELQLVEIPQVSDVTRTRLRTQLESERTRKEELIAVASREAAEQARENASFVNRTKEVMQQAVKRIRGPQT